MITFSQNETKVQVSFKLSIGYTFTIANDRQVAMDAALLRSQLNRDLNNAVEAIRKQAYELGWKDKASKKKKKDWFNSSLDRTATPAL